MSTIVSSTNIGVIATGLSPSNWKDTSNLLGSNNQSNNLYTFYEFDGTPDAGQEYDEALYLRSWGFSLPEGSVIEDIDLKIEKRATGTGAVTDADIRLYFPTAPAPAYDAANLTINQASGTPWPSTDNTVVYNGTWNKTWTDEEINNPMFGVFIRANESVTTNNTALIDHVSLTVTYHQEIFLNGTGGSSCGGSAAVEFFDNIEISGGVVVSGHATYIYPNYDGTGGSVASGTAIVTEEIFTSGGMVAGGTAIVLFESTGSGGVVVGGSASLDFNDQFEGSGGVIAGGEAKFESGLYPSGGVVAGGEVFPFGGTTIETPEGGSICGGTAEIQYTSNIEASQGVVINGESVTKTIYLNVTDGGTIANGTSLIGISVAVGGGIVIGGETNNQIGFSPVITGGIVAGGSHQQTFTDYFVASGGVRISGDGLGNKIKFFEKFKTGVCRALASDNICKEKSYSQELILPPGTDVGELDPNRFRIEYLPTWCDVDDNLQPYRKTTQNCDGAVSEVIRKRQKGIMPPKNGRAQVRDRGIANATSDAL